MLNQSKLQEKILAIVDKIGDPLMEHITERIDVAEKDVRHAVLGLVRDGTLRMKEDIIDHDWTYRRNCRGV